MYQQTPEFRATYPAETLAPIFGLDAGRPPARRARANSQHRHPAVDDGRARPRRPCAARCSTRRRTTGCARGRATSFSARTCFCLGGATPKGDVFARHFTGPPASFEDPFTGSATGGMGAFLWHYGLLKSPAFQRRAGPLAGPARRGVGGGHRPARRHRDRARRRTRRCRHPRRTDGLKVSAGLAAPGCQKAAGRKKAVASFRIRFASSFPLHALHRYHGISSLPMNPVYLLGGARTDFKRNLKKENKTLRDLVVEVARGALAATGLDAADIQAGVVGNFAGGLFTRQLHVGALLLEADDALRGIPTMHAEAACASGSLAVLTAAQWIRRGLLRLRARRRRGTAENHVARRRLRRARGRRRLPPARNPSTASSCSRSSSDASRNSTCSVTRR